MANLIYVNPFYNEEIKNEFLEQYETKAMFERLFKKSYYLEMASGYDLAEFTLDEIENLMYHMNPKTLSSARNNQSSISTYINWAIENGHRSNNINPISSAEDGWLEKFIDKTIMLYFSKEEIDEAVEMCKNKQDSSLVQMLFEGVELSEICQLKKDDVDEENGILKLRDKKGSLTKKLKVSQKCIDLVQMAAGETLYYFKNGNTTGARTAADLVDNDYVIRVGMTNAKAKDAVSPFVIHARIRMISELRELPYFTSKNIYRSGLIYYGYQLWEEAGKPENEDGLLTYEQYVNICQRFGIKKIKMGENYQYALTSIKEFINIENFKKLYED